MAVVAYLLGLGVYALYYVRCVMAASATPVGRYAGSRAYVISHLGKYVPGKALVVVMRVGLSAPAGARPATAAFATFYETIVMMAVGGFVAFAGLTFGGSGAAMIDLPRTGPVGPMLAPAAGPRRAGDGASSRSSSSSCRPCSPASRPWPACPSRTWGPTPCLGCRTACSPRASPRRSPGGSCSGLSQAAILRAMMPSGLPPSLWPAAVGSVALATVAGFAVPVSPGGLGVREWVLWTSLGTVIDPELAVVASLGLRLAWVAAEVAAGLLLLMARPHPRPEPARAATP